ncbi:hypothetical protein GGF46_002452 [Coemansia sp. RSA 552]|nr:hypothetical protein GGF46_002452 [Coemansia sp. RSA 552]
MADFGFDWEDGTEGIEAGEETEARPAVPAKEGPAVPDKDDPLREPMVADAAKEREVAALEHTEENLTPLEVFCQRAASVFIFQRVWAARAVGGLLEDAPHETGTGVLVPIAMRLAEDSELVVRETMAQNLGSVLEHYYRNKPEESEPEPEEPEPESSSESSGAEFEEEKSTPPASIVPPARVPSASAFSAWLQGVLLAPQAAVSLAAQRAVVGLGARLSFDAFHTEIVHGVVLGLADGRAADQRISAAVVKTRVSDTGAGEREQSQGGGLGAGLAALFGRRATSEDGDAFFVSAADEAARLEATRRKLLMLHMVHLVAADFGADMRPAVFVPVVERAARDRTFEVRRDAAAVLGSLARAVSPALARDVLFAGFERLATDSVWQVRQSAARHALPGLALALAARSGHTRDALLLLQAPASQRRVSLMRLARPSGQPIPDELGSPGDQVAEALNAHAFRNQPPRPVDDAQWLQLIERLAGSREPSAHVRAAVFEAAGRLALALVDCPRARDSLVALVVDAVARAHGGRSLDGGLFGSAASLQSLDGGDSDSDGGGPAPNHGSGGLRQASQSTPIGADVLFHSAFNVPALLAALGPRRGWERLRDTYMQLSKSDHRAARRSLASSLHEVARILAANAAPGPGAARLAANRVSAGPPADSSIGAAAAAYSADLESVLCLFLIDAVEIKMAALEHLGDTLTWLTPASRVRCLPMISQVFRHDGALWRTRQLMAQQLVKLCYLFPPAVVVASLLPQAVSWAHDPVAGVRAAVAPAFPIVFELTKLDPATHVRFFETVISFSHSRSFRGRLFFVEICAALLAHDGDPDADPVDFDQFFLPSLAALAHDRVANVRIALARLVRRMLENRMRRQSISATLADMWVVPDAHEWADMPQEPVPRSRSGSTASTSSGVASRPRHASRPMRLRSNTRSSVESGSDAEPRSRQHRSLGPARPQRRRTRRNTTPMRAHLLATMVHQLAADSDRDVLELVQDLPGLPLTTQSEAEELSAETGADKTTVDEKEEREGTKETDETDETTKKESEESKKKDSSAVSSMLLQFPRPPADTDTADTDSSTLTTTLEEEDDDDDTALDDLLSSYQRDEDEQPHMPSSSSALSQPISHSS